MPAIQPARLRQQAVLLAEYFDQPAAFLRSLNHLLDFYADRTHRPGQAGVPSPLLAAYNVKPPVMRQVLQELAPLVQSRPDQALALCDALWSQPYLEPRLLAASILGLIPARPADPVVQRIESWIEPGSEERLLQALLIQGLAGVRREDTERLFQLVEAWLSSPEVFPQQLGLRALAPLAGDPNFENLPVLFRLIAPLVRAAPPGLRPDLLDLLGILAQRTPRETAFYLRQTLEASHSPVTAWLIRQSLDDFPEELQDDLRAAAREPAV